MVKVLQINVTANWGSTGKIAESIGMCILNSGWESYIAYGRYVNPSKSKLIRVGSQFETYMHYIEQRVLDNEGLCSRRATRKLVKQINQVKPDIVHLHNIHDHYLNYNILFDFLNRSKIKVVWTFHDCWAFTGHCTHFSNINCDRWKIGCHNCLMKENLLDNSKKNWEHKKNLFSNCKDLTIVSCSEWMGRFVRESFFKYKKNIVIHNGIDIKKFYPQPVLKKTSKFIVLAVSNVWHTSKGLYDIYKLRSNLPMNIEIVMVGLHPRQIKKLPLGIKGYIRTQNIQELVQFYSEADVFINPTYSDTFPTVNIESLACGTPVITYNTGGSPEAVDENTGCVVEQGNIKALAAKIVEFKDAGFKMEHSEDCRKRAEECFDKDKSFNKYLTLYKSLLRKKQLE